MAFIPYQIMPAKAITGSVLITPLRKNSLLDTPSSLASTVRKNPPSLLGRITAAIIYESDSETNNAAPWLSDPSTSTLIAIYSVVENIPSKKICGRVDGSKKIVSAESDLRKSSEPGLFIRCREPTIG